MKKELVKQEQIITSDKAVIYLNQQGNISSINSFAENLTGWTAKDACNTHLSKVFVLEDKNLKEMFFSEIIQKNISFKTNAFIINRNQEKASVSLTVVPPSTDNSFTLITFSKLKKKRDPKAKLKKYAQQQEIIAELGLNALKGQPPDLLISDAISRICLILEVQFCKLSKLLPDGRTLIIEASTGWDPELIRNFKREAGSDSLSGYTLLVKQPVIMENIHKETRFKIPSILYEHNITSALSVIIENDKNPYGVLNVYSLKENAFIKDDLNFLQGVANILAEAINRKQAEINMANSESNYRMLMEQAADGIYVADKSGRFLNVNSQACLMLGYAKEELLELSVMDLIPPEDKVKKPARLKDLADAKGEVLFTERKLLCKNGRIIFAELRSKIMDNGNLFAIARDITERKKTEEQLFSRERELRTILENTPDIISRYDKNLRYTFINSAVKKVNNLQPSFFIGKSYKELNLETEKDAYLENIVKKVFETGKEIVNEINFEVPGGKLWYQITWVPEFCKDGREVESVLSIGRNITDLKNKEKLITESEKNYRMLMEQASYGIIVKDREGNYIYANSKACEIFGYSKDELLKLNVKDIISPQDLKKNSIRFKGFIQDRTTIYESEVTCKDKTVKYIEFSSKMLNNGSFQSIIRDITEQKKIVDLEHKRGRELKALVENAHDLIVRIDSNLCYAYANLAMERALGKPPDFYIGKSHYQIGVPLEIAEAMRTMIKEVFKTGGELIFEHSFPGLDGTVWYQARLVPEFDKVGNSVESVLIISRDITKHKEIEKLLKFSLAEKELLLKEIHHRIKNNLQIVSSLLNLQSGYIKNPEALEIFRDSQNRIKTMAYIHEKLYQSTDLARIYFSDYLGNLTTNLFQSYNVNTANISLNLDIKDLLLNIDIAIPCGMIINELISNSLKYAFPGREKGTIKVQITEEEKEIILIVSDSGIGMPAGLDMEKTETLGLQLIFMLISQISARVKINCDKGTEFRIFIPQQE